MCVRGILLGEYLEVFAFETLIFCWLGEQVISLGDLEGAYPGVQQH